MQRKISALPMRLTPQNAAKRQRRRLWPRVLLIAALVLPAAAAIALVLIGDPSSPTAGARVLDRLAHRADRALSAVWHGVASVATDTFDLCFDLLDRGVWSPEVVVCVGCVLCVLAAMLLYRKALP